MRAQTDLGQARDAGAEQRAPYEYTRADRYLEKAHEEYLGGVSRLHGPLTRVPGAVPTWEGTVRRLKEEKGDD